jgi:hypothetical protein
MTLLSSAYPEIKMGTSEWINDYRPLHPPQANSLKSQSAQSRNILFSAETRSKKD